MNNKQKVADATVQTTGKAIDLIKRNPRSSALWAMVAGSIGDVPVMDGFVPALVAGASAFLETLDASI